MLSELYIKNLAIIEEAAIPFSDNFNVFTGETGAGKSILINGINAVLGQRITKDIVRAGCDKAVITALFTELSDNVCARLDELGIAHEDRQLTLTREVSSDGGSIARVNSRASTVSVLREIGECLVNIHGQHDNQILMDPEKHLSILDSYGDLEAQAEDYRSSFRQLQEVSRKLKKLTLERREQQEREQLLREKITEIGSLDISENEDEAIEAEYKIAQSSEEICSSLNEAYSFIKGIDDSDVPGAIELISNACDDISSFSDTVSSMKSLSERLENVRVELDDIASEISSEIDKIDIDAERYAYLSERLNDLNRIKKKYGPELSDVLDCYNKASEEISRFESSSDEIEEVIKTREQLLSCVSDKAKQLSAARAEAAERFSAQVEEELSFLDMPNVKIKASMEKGKLTAAGMDSVEFLISTNAGEGMKPMSKIASGGELSRIMLALKNVIAEKDNIHTLILDEIDTGVSGRAAQKIGIKLKSVSAHQQVLCVTHLSQMAVMADNHLLIEKQTRDGRTYTSVHKLDFEERKREIARIMVGENITDTALKNAEELLLNGDKI
ncbi:MAG: DNA repair protein RecN [Oscillospiraceae bacterium]|nr:DNA repair protein RecN [Oscillospiraceae bacterium]